MDIYNPNTLLVAEARGWDREAHANALVEGDDDAVCITHPANFLTEPEVEGELYALQLRDRQVH